MERHHGQQKYQRQAGNHDIECDFVRRFLPLCAFHQGDHAIQKRFARIRRDTDLDPVRQHFGPAGDRATVPSGFADHGRTLTSDRGLVDAGYSLNNLAVAWNDVSRVTNYDIALPKPAGRNVFDFVAVF